MQQNTDEIELIEPLMCIIPSDRFKIFGAAVDAADDPWTLQLKHAVMQAQDTGRQDLSSDPYAALLPLLPHRDRPNMVQHGRFPTPDWLQPIPPPSARQQVTQENMTRFVAAGGMLDLARRLQSFVQDTIFPEHPFMLGVDHAMTGGVVAALAERYGRNELSIVIIDQHFDGLPLSLRVDTAMLPNGPALPGTGSDDLDDAYCCGNFVRHLIDTGTILPENLLFIGVADYPGEQVTPGNERFKENYLAMEKRGCRFFPAARFKGRYHQDLEQFIARHITTPNVYVSLDMDVGAHRCVHAARYMDTTGISREALRHIARAIAAGCGRGRYRLAGLDAVEFNMHFLGLEYEPGHRDATLSVALEFITEMIGAPDGP